MCTPAGFYHSLETLNFGENILGQALVGFYPLTVFLVDWLEQHHADAHLLEPSEFVKNFIILSNEHDFVFAICRLKRHACP